jgi:hypothetical protein
MPKNYTVGVNRKLSVKKQDGDLHVTIGEEGSDVKTVTFSSQRWAQFVEIMEQIDEAVNTMMAKQYVQYVQHIGGKWYVSVTTGFQCVDIRQFYYHSQKGPSPSKTGIALRIPEWTTLKDLVQQLHQKYPVLKAAQPHYQSSHQNQEEALICNECHPFQLDELLRSMMP